jgi:UPF0716 protein FxsA
MKRVCLAIGIVAALEVVLLWRLEQRTSLWFVAAYLLLSAASGIAVIAHTARQALGLAPSRTTAAPPSPADRLLTLLAGVLLIVPGILSDLLGLLLLAPTGKTLARRWLGPRWRAWAASGSNLSGTWARFGQAPSAAAETTSDEHTIDVTSRPVSPRKRVSTPKP